MQIPVPDPPLHDDVVSLRPWTLTDAPAVAAACQDPEIPRWTTVPSPYAEADALAWLEGVTHNALEDQRHLAVTSSQGGTLIGSISLWIVKPGVAEIGYWTEAGARGRGHTSRALRLLSRWALDQLRLPRLQLGTLLGNAASERVAEKVGFKPEGVLRSFLDQRGTRVDVRMWSLLPGELLED